MPRTTLYVVAPRAVAVRTDPIPDPQPHQVRVRTTYSAISPGTELLVYRGEAPEAAGDEAIDPVTGRIEYPIAYGYSAVGVVEAVGREVDAAWEGRRVFGFQPHTSHFCCAPDALVPLPEALADRDAVLLPNVETAVNLVMDGRPVLGERVLVLGQGVVGLLTTALLARFPLELLATTDRYAARRAMSLDLGADRALDPADPATDRWLCEALDTQASPPKHGYGADLLFELTGQPAALDDALRYAGFESRIVVGSWYGTRRAPVNLGAKFHRHRIRLVSSQVSTVASRWRGRWDKARRMRTAMAWMRAIRPARLITHVTSLDDAGEAFRLLDESPQEAIQIVFSYDATHETSARDV